MGFLSMPLAIALTLVCVTACSAAAAQQTGTTDRPVQVLSLDPDLSFDTGADLLLSTLLVFGDVEHLLVSRIGGPPALKVPLGIAKALLLDHPVAVFLLVMQHEAFGHGGRAREFGAKAAFTMGSPWTKNALFNGGTRFGGGASWGGRELTAEQRGRVYAGGTEANTRSASLIERELASGAWMRTPELLYYVRSRWYASQYVLRTPHPAISPAGFFAESRSGDVAVYLGELNRKYYGDFGIGPTGVAPTVLTEYQRLRRNALISLAAPGAWLALWSAGRDVAIGADARAIPSLRIGGRRFLPSIGSDWMVDGGALTLEGLVSGRERTGAERRWFTLVSRLGNGPGGRFWNAGAASSELMRWRSLSLGGEMEAWRQPSFGAGAGMHARLSVNEGWIKGLVIYAGVKSDGDWPGRPANSGGFFRVGYRTGPTR